MVKGLINFLSREVSELHQAAYLLGFFAILSQVLALVRDRLLAHAFGAGATLDLYYAAFRIPDFIFAIVASLFSASIVIPFLSEKIKSNVETGREFLSVIFSVFLCVIVAVSFLAFFLIPYLIPHLFPGFASDPLKSQIVLLSRILLLSPILLGLSNLLASVTQLYNRFFIYGISPLLYNAGIIFGVLFLAPRFGTTGLVFGVIIGAVLHFLVQVPFVASRGLLPRLVLSFKKFKAVSRVMLIALPRTLSISALEISEFFLISIASAMSVGSVSIFSFSHNLEAVPLSIIGVSYSLAAFPSLTALFVNGNREKFVDLLLTTARYIIFFSMPLVALFIVLRAQIVRVILGSGSFSWEDTRLTAAALAIFTISLAAQGLVLLFTRAQYAAGNTKTPFYINIFSVVIIIVGASFLWRLNLDFPSFRFFIESLFRVDDIPGTTVLMLPLAFSIGNIFAATTHIVAFERQHGGVAKTLAKVTAEMTVVAVMVGLVSYFVLDLLGNKLSLDTFLGVFVQGLVAGVAGTICGIILLVLMDSRELKEVWRAFKRKIWKTPVIGPDAGEI